MYANILLCVLIIHFVYSVHRVDKKNKSFDANYMFISIMLEKKKMEKMIFEIVKSSKN